MSKRVSEDQVQNDGKRSCGDLNEYENPHFMVGQIVRAFYGGQWYDNAVILTLKPEVAVEWRNYRKYVQEGIEKTSWNATATYFLQSDFSCWRNRESLSC